jgi:hypothetical protein
MAHFLRDRHITNLSITEDNITQLSEVLSDRANTLNSNVQKNDNPDKEAALTYIIRFDDKGCRVFSLEELLRYFCLAKEVERISFTVETGESQRSSRQRGTYLELKLDGKDPNACLLIVTSDDKDWVDTSFSAIQDTLAKGKNRNGWVRTAWTRFGVKITGITLGFILSLWAADKIAPTLAIENSFVLTFLFVLLILSNTWTYLNQGVLSVLNKCFPNMKFCLPDKEGRPWLMQAIIGAIVIAIVVYLMGQTFSFLSEVFTSLLRKET